MKRIILICISLSLVLLIGLFCWYKFAWPRYIDKLQVVDLCTEINKSEPLPNEFYLIYDKLYPKQRQTRITKTYMIGVFKMFFSKTLPRELVSPTRYISHLYFLSFPTENELRIKKDFPLYFSFAIDKYTETEKCFDYYINHYDFIYKRIGLEAASLGYYDKCFNDLSKDEILGLIAMLENPHLYNPKRQPDRYKQKVLELKEKLNNK